MAKKIVREDRDASPEFKELDVMEPIDISVFGTDDDPCFGKHYDLSTDECQRCGDHEFCALKMGQTLHKTRAKVEKKNDFLDVQEEIDGETKPSLSTAKMRKLVRVKRKKGLSFLKTYKSIKRRYPDVDKVKLKEIYNNG